MLERPLRELVAVLQSKLSLALIGCVELIRPKETIRLGKHLVHGDVFVHILDVQFTAAETHHMLL